MVSGRDLDALQRSNSWTDIFFRRTECFLLSDDPVARECAPPDDADKFLTSRSEEGENMTVSPSPIPALDPPLLPEMHPPKNVLYPVVSHRVRELLEEEVTGDTGSRHGAHRRKSSQVFSEKSPRTPLKPEKGFFG